MLTGTAHYDDVDELLVNRDIFLQSIQRRTLNLKSHLIIYMNIFSCPPADNKGDPEKKLQRSGIKAGRNIAENKETLKNASGPR